jgi:carbon storage regulator
MLVLSRKTGERIHIGDNITIEIRRVAGNRVTLALDAPRAIRILRGELEQAAREFRNLPEPEVQCDGLAGHCATTNDPGPEPYAILQRRLTVVTEVPQPPVPTDFVV